MNINKIKEALKARVTSLNLDIAAVTTSNVIVNSAITSPDKFMCLFRKKRLKTLRLSLLSSLLNPIRAKQMSSLKAM